MDNHVTFILRSTNASHLIACSNEANPNLNSVIAAADGRFLGLATEEPNLTPREWSDLLSQAGHLLAGFKAYALLNQFSRGQDSDQLDRMEIYLHVTICRELVAQRISVQFEFGDSEYGLKSHLGSIFTNLRGPSESSNEISCRKRVYRKTIHGADCSMFRLITL